MNKNQSNTVVDYSINTSYLIKFVLIFSMALMFSACSHERPIYQGAEAYKNLEIPPDLTRPDSSEALRIPEAPDSAVAGEKKQTLAENAAALNMATIGGTASNTATSSVKYKGVKVVNDFGESWLEVDKSASELWLKLKRFAEAEGIAIVTERPQLGFIETDWTTKLDTKKGFFKSMFQNFEPDQLDKFRFRVQGNTKSHQSRIYIAHSRIERIIFGEDSDEYGWKTIAGDIETERELLARLARFLGLTQQQSEQQAQSYRSYSPLVKKDDNDSAAFSVAGGLDFVWQRTLHALDRMNMTNVNPQKAKKQILFDLNNLDDIKVQVTDDELSKSSWLMNLIRGKKDVAVVGANKHYRLQLSELKGRIKVAVVDGQNSANSDEDEVVNSDALTEQLTAALIKQMQ